ncbi:MAG: membrane fusion protein (multidrug efflux system) [Cellvibrionaceae bacterium]
MRIFTVKKELVLKKSVLTIFVLAVIAVFFWQYGLPTIQRDRSQPKAQPARAVSQGVKVITQAVEFTANDRTFETVGTSRAKFSADIYPAVAEQVMAVNFESQQKVNQGDILVQLDNREEIVALKLAKAELKNARSLLNRYEKATTIAQNTISERDLEAVRTDYEVAQAARDQAILALEDRKVLAPFTGVVGIPNINVGERIDTDTLITGLDARDIVYVDFEVPESLASALRTVQAKNHAITATTPSYPGKTFDAVITAQESRINPQRRTLQARVSIDNQQDLLRPGMSFAMRWKIPGQTYATIPEISLQWSGEGSFVWIIREGKADKVAARVISRKAGRVLVEAVIAEGEPVVVEGLQRLRPDVAVTLLNTAKTSKSSQGQANE